MAERPNERRGGPTNDRVDDTSTHHHACEPGWIVGMRRECITEMYPVCSLCERDSKQLLAAVQQGLPMGKWDSVAC